MDRTSLFSFSRHEVIGMIGLVVLALGVRLYWVHHNRMWQGVTVFEAGQTAQRIVAGEGFAGAYHGAPYGPTAIPYPFYTYFLAAWYAAFGLDRAETAHYAIMLVQCVVASVLPVLTYVIARRLFNPGIAALGAVAVALDYFLAVLCGYISQSMWHGLAVALVVCAAIAAADRPRVGWSVLAGVSIGLGAMVKTTVVLAWPAVAWWIWRRADAPRTRRLVLIGAMGVACALVLAPLVVRNDLAFGKWGVLNNSGGLNFWQGNCEFANGGTYTANGVHIQHLVAQSLRDEVGRLNEAEGSAVFYREGWRWAAANPGRFLKLRVMTVFYAYYNQNYWMDPQVFPYNPALKWMTVVLVTGCVVGMFFSRPWWRGHSLLVATIVVQTAFYAFYHADIDNRFRMPLEPFLLMYGSALVWRAGCWWRGRSCIAAGAP